MFGRKHSVVKVVLTSFALKYQYYIYKIQIKDFCLTPCIRKSTLVFVKSIYIKVSKIKVLVLQKNVPWLNSRLLILIHQCLSSILILQLLEVEF